ncbi:MAG TPA: hypothetical protein VN783_05375 [Thermoanaerobaculia bacterium]|nr:hypothetical protein [Thermoanaerobaculia bacterium]
MADEADDPVEPVLKLLDRLVREAKFSGRALDRRLGYARGQASAILSGQQHLRYRHVLDILGALGVEPKDFFGLLYWDSSEERLPGPLEPIFRRQAGLGPKKKTAPQPAKPQPDEPRGDLAPSDPVIVQLVELVQTMIDRGLASRFRQLTAELAKLNPEGEEALKRSETPDDDDAS